MSKKTCFIDREATWALQLLAVRKGRTANRLSTTTDFGWAATLDSLALMSSPKEAVVSIAVIRGYDDDWFDDFSALRPTGKAVRS